MRVLFAASPAIAIPSLEAAASMDGIELAGVLTNPDSSKGRNSTLVPTEVGAAAAKISGNIPVLKPEKLDASAREQVSALKPDLLVSFAYGHIFGPKFMALFPLGGINIHPSLLPKYRGPSPIQAAILNRDSRTGISIQSLAPKMDCGDILAREEFQLTGTETAGSLGGIVAQKAAAMLPGVLAKIASGTAKGEPQDDGEASYCSLIGRDNGLIDWAQGAAQIEAKIRAFDPWPLCRTIHTGRELFILKAGIYGGNAPKEGPAGLVLGIDKQAGILVQTGEGLLSIAELQYYSKKALPWRDFLNGARDFTGSKLG
jgi:methionyl-tRNA formyltransferase